MTINATAATLLCLYVAVADERGIAARQARRGRSRTTSSRSTSRAARTSTRRRRRCASCADTFAFCARELPRWNTISISGYHIREAGSDAVQEVAFTLADGIAYVEAARAAGLAVDAFAPRLSFFFNAHAHLLEEVAKFRAARRLWARIMRDRFDARDPRSQMLRFHAQTAGSTLTAVEPLNNVARTTVEALAAVLGGAQSIHTNGYDEALALPTEASARVALRTQQILAHESGVGDVVDPLGGAYAIEALTSEIEARAAALHRGDRPAGRHGGGHRGRLPAAGDRAAGPRAPARRRERRARDRRRQPLHRRWRRGRRRRSTASIRRSRPPRSRASRGCATRRDAHRGARRARRSAGIRRRRRQPLPAILLAAVKARATLGEIADVFARRLRGISAGVAVASRLLVDILQGDFGLHRARRKGLPLSLLTL